MANRKISDLTALTAPAAGDLLPIVDISEAAAADKNKKITYGELLSSAPAGSAAAPSFSFDGDPNSGLYSAGADQVAISTGGSGRLFASGRLLVGTSTSISAGLIETAGSSFATSAVVARITANDTNPTGFVGAKIRGTSINQSMVKLQADIPLTVGRWLWTALRIPDAGFAKRCRTKTAPLALTTCQCRLCFHCYDRRSGQAARSERHAHGPQQGAVGVGSSSPWSLMSVGNSGTVGDVTSARQISVGLSTNYNVSFGYYQTAAASAFAGVIQAIDGAVGTPLLLNPSGGRVGIGTSSPQSILNLSSTGPVITLTRNNSADTGSGAINFATSDNTVRWQVGTNQAVGAGLEINRGAGTNNAVYIDTSNRVGIGTTGPQAIFHSKAGATTSAGIFESTSASGSFLSFADTGTNSYTRVQVGSVGNTNWCCGQTIKSDAE
jgi:hypothetical protein